MVPGFLLYLPCYRWMYFWNRANNCYMQYMRLNSVDACYHDTFCAQCNANDIPANVYWVVCAATKQAFDGLEHGHSIQHSIHILNPHNGYSIGGLPEYG